MRHALRFTDYRDNHIRLLRGVNGFIDHRLRRTRVNLYRFFIQVEEIDNAFVVGDIRPFGVQHFALFADGIFNPRQHRYRLIGNTGGGPTAHYITLAVGQRSDNRHGGGFFQRQRFQTVFQQHQAFARHFTRLFAMQTAFCVGVLWVRFFGPQMAVRIVKQPHIIFHVQHVACGVVQLRHRHFAGFNQARQIFAVILIAHTHVDAGLDRHTHRIFRIRGGTVLNQFLNRAVIGNGNPLKAPFISQHVF